jgi:tRNA threonylcarbamoyladenosine biosynthesis protein TsaB
MAIAGGIPVYTLTSLDVMAWRISIGYRYILPLIDARKGEVYGALYRSEGGRYERISDYISISPENLVYKVINPETFIFGPGYIRHRNYFNSKGFGPYEGEGALSSLLDAGALLECYYSGEGYEEFSAGDVEPVYVRPSEAELKFRRRGK